MSNLIAIPTSFAAGTTVRYTRGYSDYPANAGWTATLLLAGASLVSAPATASGLNFVYLLTAAQTAPLAAGNYQWREVVFNAGTGDKFVADFGVVQVLPNIESAGAGDMQTWEEKTLAVVEAALEGRLASDMESYQIAGRAVVKIPAHELMKLRNDLRRAVNAQQRPGTIGPHVRVTFPPAGCY